MNEREQREERYWLQVQKYSKAMLLVLGVCLIIKGVSGFWIGFHNVDLCVNEAGISKYYNMEAYEMTMNKQKWSFMECYMSGINSAIIGFFISMGGSFICGAFIFKDD